MVEHPTPWKVTYWRRCEEWDERSCPRIVDANGELVCTFPQMVFHPGIYDAVTDEMAKRIVEAVNGLPVFVVLDHRDEPDQLRHRVAYSARAQAETLAAEVRQRVKCPASAIEVVELKREKK